MKKSYVLPLLILFAACTSANAQMVGDCVFLKGNFVEVGIAPNGGYGAPLPAPAGYHPNLGGSSFTFWDPGAGSSTTSTTFLGFVADVGADGWAVGTPGYIGDFYLPGHPQEGWAIRSGTTEANAFIPLYMATGSTGYTAGLTGTSTGYTIAGRVKKGIWEGAKGALAIRQTTNLDTTKLYFTVDVVLRNTGATPIDNIYYIRTVDPDNEVTTAGGGGFTTVNNITYQLPNPENKVLVSATGSTYSAYLGLGTKDCRAKCMIFNAGLDPTFPLDQMWAQTTTYLYTVGSSLVNDVGIALEFNIGTIAPGDSTILSYAYILNATFIDSALNSLQPVFTVGGIAHDSTDTINLCVYPYDTVNVAITGGGFYNWSWAPDSFLSSNVGPTVTIHSDSVSSNITYTITGTSSAGGCNTVKYYLTLEHGTFPGPPVTPVSYCEGATAVPLTPSGIGYTWYTTATGGVGTTVSPTPSTTVPGTYYYYVTKDTGLCVSLRSPDTVTIKPLPPPPALFGTTPYCQGQPFVAFTTTGTGVLWYTAATGGVGSSTAPTVNTFIPGIYTFYASQTIIGCEGPRQAISTTVLDSIVPSFTYTVHLGCNGDTVIFTNTSVNALHYVWSFGDGTTDTVTNPIHVYTAQGTFHVSLLGINDACEDSSAVDIPLIHPIVAAFTASPMIVCQGSPVSFTNGSTGTTLTYQWHFGDGASDTATNPQHTFQNTGAYDVELVATDFVPCQAVAHVTVQVDSIAQISASVSDTALCQGTYVTFSGTYTDIGNIGVSWVFNDGDSIHNVNPVVHSFNAEGVYTVSLTPHYRVCRDTTATKVVTVIRQPQISLGRDTAICTGSEALTLKDELNAGNPAATWRWSNGSQMPTSTIVAPGAYYAIVTINSCSASDTVVVASDCYMNIPNVFTPNGDGVNDFFYPRSLLSRGLTAFNMNIYNRWGQLIFETTSLSGAGWDGKLNGVPQPQGVFVYVVDATFRDGQKEHHQGNVTLIR
ncbi:MAG: PKD domain-containing protein [Bacteroidota bacterium]